MITFTKNKNKILISFLIKDLHNSIISYKKFSHYMFKLNGDIYSKKFYHVRHLENQAHNDYTYYINNAMNQLQYLFKNNKLSWDECLKIHHIVNVENYAKIILTQIKQDIKNNNTKNQQDANILNTLDLASTDRNSNIEYNVHNNENRTDTSVNIIVIYHIYLDLNKALLNTYIRKFIPIINDYKKQWIHICKSELLGNDIDINYVN